MVVVIFVRYDRRPASKQQYIDLLSDGVVVLLPEKVHDNGNTTFN